MTLLLGALLLTGCHKKGPYSGTAPEIAKPAPEFSATNYDGTPREKADLLGKPTAMWFYPKAATVG